MLVSMHDYWMGRDATHPLDLAPDYIHNAEILLDLVNRLLVIAQTAGVALPTDPKHPQYGCVASGWRPPEINANTPGASPNSKHMTGQAIDVYDPDGDLDEWLESEDGRRTLEMLGLWVENSACTKSWAHLQSVPPRSGRRYFFP